MKCLSQKLPILKACQCFQQLKKLYTGTILEANPRFGSNAGT